MCRVCNDDVVLMMCSDESEGAEDSEKDSVMSERSDQSEDSKIDSDMSGAECANERAMNAFDMNEIWIGDTGASCHLVRSDIGMKNIKKIKEHIKIGDGSKLRAKKIGDLPVIIEQKDGKQIKAVLKNVKYVPNLLCNLFSILSVMNKGWSLGNDKSIVKLSKGKSEIKFDHEMKTKNGYLAGVKIIPEILEDKVKGRQCNVSPDKEKGRQCNVSPRKRKGQQCNVSPRNRIKCWAMRIVSREKKKETL